MCTAGFELCSVAECLGEGCWGGGWSQLALLPAVSTTPPATLAFLRTQRWHVQLAILLCSGTFLVLAESVSTFGWAFPGRAGVVRPLAVPS